MREQVVSAANFTEAASMAKNMFYRFYLIEPYEHGLPIVEEMNTEAAGLGLPHNLRKQAV